MKVKEDLKSLFIKTIAAGLRRQGLTSCSRWACACRVMGGKSFPGPWSFKYYPWSREMHDADCDFWVGQKAAQMGYTEVALNRTFYKIDIDHTDCLYVLPAKTPDASDFSAARFDSALELSPYLGQIFSDVKNVGHKRAGSTNLYIRGSRSKSGLKSVPVGLLILDELEEMTQENIPLAFERQSGQIEKQTIALSTPRVPGRGINIYYETSTQENFFFNCPHCHRWIDLTFPDSILMTAEDLNDPRINETHIICKVCKKELIHESKSEWLANGKWIASHTNRDVRGFHINQLYSCTVHPAEIARSYFRAQRNQADEQEFFNSKLGQTHTVTGARVNEDEINKCIHSFKNRSYIPYSYPVITLGIDQGKWIHYEIDAWHIPAMSPDIHTTAICRVVDFGKVLNFEELDELVKTWRVNACVIDAQPERRKASEFASRFPGFVHLCFYSDTVKGKSLKISQDYNDPVVTVDRTYWLDQALGRFRNQSIELPMDINLEYKSHIMAPMRIYEKDQYDVTVGRYVKADADQDHHTHARAYSEIALCFAANLSTTYVIKSPR